MKVLMESQEDTRALVKRAHEGERTAFDQLISRYDDRIRALVHARLASYLKVEFPDVYQETLTRAYRAIKDFTWQGEDSFLRWLGGISEYVILNLVRRHSRRKHLPIAHEPIAPDASPSRDMRRNERFDRLQNALDNLSEDHGTALRLAHLEGLKTKEIAERMNRSPEAVRQLLWRALKQLRTHFDDTESLGLPSRRLLDNGTPRDE